MITAIAEATRAALAITHTFTAAMADETVALHQKLCVLERVDSVAVQQRLDSMLIDHPGYPVMCRVWEHGGTDIHATHAALLFLMSLSSEPTQAAFWAYVMIHLQKPGNTPVSLGLLTQTFASGFPDKVEIDFLVGMYAAPPVRLTH